MSIPPDSPLRPEPSASAGKSGSQVPPSVKYARGLLYLQAAIWACLATGGAVATVSTLIQVLVGHRTWGSFAAEVGWLPAVAALTGGFAVTKISLARRLVAGRAGLRKVVIAVQIAMTCLGALLTAGVDPSGGMPADFVALAAIVGGGLSLAAALGLLRRRARQYFADPGLAGGTTADSNSDSNAGCSGLLSAPARIRLRCGITLAWPPARPEKRTVARQRRAAGHLTYA